MSYYPSEALTRESVELYGQVLTALDKGNGLKIQAHDFLNPATLATKVRVALKSADEFPMIMPNAVGIKKRVIVKTDMREWCVWIVPKESERRLSQLSVKEVGITTDRSTTITTIDCEGKDLASPAGIVWLASRLQSGARTFTSFDAPMLDEVRHAIDARLSASVGMVVDKWTPPELVTFKEVPHE